MGESCVPAPLPIPAADFPPFWLATPKRGAVPTNLRRQTQQIPEAETDELRPRIHTNHEI